MLNRSYLLWMALSAVITAGAHFDRAARMWRRGLLVLLTLVFGAVLGPVCARVGYCVLQPDYALGYGLKETLLSRDMSMMCFFCGAAGVIAGAALAAKCTDNPVRDALNVYAPAGALMAALARFGEYFLGQNCTGAYIENETFCVFPLAVSNEWGEWYLAVYLFAGLAALAAAALSMWRFRKEKFLQTVFALCLPQVLLESLRSQSLMWSQFVRVEQLLCMVTVEVVLILLGLKAPKGTKRFLPALIGLLCAGLFVAVEFAVGGKLFVGTAPIVFYAVMALGLAVLAFAESRLVRLLPRASRDRDPIW